MSWDTSTSTTCVRWKNYSKSKYQTISAPWQWANKRHVTNHFLWSDTPIITSFHSALSFESAHIHVQWWGKGTQYVSAQTLVLEWKCSSVHTSCGRVFFENLTVAQLLENLPLLYKILLNFPDFPQSLPVLHIIEWYIETNFLDRPRLTRTNSQLYTVFFIEYNTFTYPRKNIINTYIVDMIH
jgi:hypothetical protein